MEHKVENKITNTKFCCTKNSVCSSIIIMPNCNRIYLSGTDAGIYKYHHLNTIHLPSPHRCDSQKIHARKDLRYREVRNSIFTKDNESVRW
jgi:hypothetical protein